MTQPRTREELQAALDEATNELQAAQANVSRSKRQASLHGETVAQISARRGDLLTELRRADPAAFPTTRKRSDIEGELTKARMRLAEARARENCQGGGGLRREARAECVRRVAALEAELYSAPPEAPVEPESYKITALREAHQLAATRLEDASLREGVQGGGDGRRETRERCAHMESELRAKLAAAGITVPPPKKRERIAPVEPRDVPAELAPGENA
jgi:chromosome segregation ATPase